MSADSRLWSQKEESSIRTEMYLYGEQSEAEN